MGRVGHRAARSGGSGAAVAAGLCVAALCTDTLGSVRIPGRLLRGVLGSSRPRLISQEGLELVAAGFDTIGPLARTLDDLEALVPHDRDRPSRADPRDRG
jgi:aspartyl-tRNA(Asn)/glutamyl-tRNA(Gln) amidotransferase subunit A